MLFSTSKWCCLYLLGKITVNTQGETTYQEGGSVSRVNIGRLITTSVTSRDTSMIFQNGGQFFCSLFFAKDDNFPEIWKLLLPYSNGKTFEK